VVFKHFSPICILPSHHLNRALCRKHIFLSWFWLILVCRFFFFFFLVLEKAMAPHSSTLAWKIPRMEEPGRLRSMGLLRVRHDWATSLSLFTFMHWEGNGNPLQCSCLENPRDGEAWWAAVYGITQSRTRLKRLSSSRMSWRFSPGLLFFSPKSFIVFPFTLKSVIHLNFV